MMTVKLEKLKVCLLLGFMVMMLTSCYHRRSERLQHAALVEYSDAQWRKVKTNNISIIKNKGRKK